MAEQNPDALEPQDGDPTAMEAPSPSDPEWNIRLEHKLGLLDKLRLVGYAGHGTDTTLYVEGRLIERKGQAGDPDESSVWENVKNTFHRFASDEIPGARIRVRFRDDEYDVWTDNEGFFKINLPLEEPLEGGWHDVDLEVVESIKEDDDHPTATARMLVPSHDVEFAVVSDLDDTVIKSAATSTFEKVELLFGKSAAKRSPFVGVETFYEALVRGPDEKGINPIFYVSRSGWNLYDLFVRFFEEKNIPPGPLFLQDLAIKEDKSAALGNERHKRDRIQFLLESHPRLPFVFIGDSGQEDPEIYRQLVHQNPGRVLAVYIRDVTPDDRDREVRKIADELNARGVATCLVKNTVEAAEHAVEVGLISEAALKELKDKHGEVPDSEREV